MFQKLYEGFSLYYPFTWNGTFLLVISLFLLGIAWGTLNMFALIFSILGIFWLVFVMIVGFISKIRNQESYVLCELQQTIYSRLINQHIQVSAESISVPFFLRMHYILKGKIKVGRKAFFYLYFEGSKLPSENFVSIPVYFPFCGIANLKGYAFIKDILNLIKIPLKKPDEIKISIHPPLFSEKPQIQIMPSSTLESTKKIQTSDEEKYFMREYIPGDRLKDINWKSSIKLNELITKISPLSPEESKTIHIEIRPYHYHKNKDGINAILQINYLKSWVLSFIRAWKQQNPKYKFHVNTGKEILHVNEDNDIEILSRKLSELEYITQPSLIDPSNSLEKFIFSTSFDIHLHDYLQNAKSKIYLFHVGYGEKRKVGVLKTPSLNVLPGLWVFRKERLNSQPPKPMIGKLIEESLKAVII
ncbi:MAG: DUF58 domain-containing protein [Leptospiraceae bacterium]|nr:DUF58 domain-containing protein [Leptospiraceae bacterium]MDW7975685.1 DUF58 domain-containing protein [Leptospiraceae bacterium]